MSRGKPLRPRYYPVNLEGSREVRNRRFCIDDDGVHTGFCRSGRVGKVAGLKRHGYVFCVSGVTLFVHEEAYGGYGFHPVGGGDTEEKEELHFIKVEW